VTREGINDDDDDDDDDDVNISASSSSSTSSLLKVVKTQLTHKSITIFIRHTYCEIITEEHVNFVNKSVVAPCFKIIAFICFIREQRGYRMVWIS